MSPEQIQQAVHDARIRNLRYASQRVLGLPGSVLDAKVFPPLPSLRDFGMLATFMDNPNHIGCHTLGESEPAFAGTHELERQVLSLCAEQILGAEPGTTDGYVASGGTESNIQALWTYRNLFRDELGAAPGHIGVLCSEDTHYSIAKGADLLSLSLWTVPVHPERRTLQRDAVARTVDAARAAGVRYLVVVLNMGTTMFGSVDDADEVLPVIEARDLPYKAHVDAAFGGFIYPFTAENRLSFTDGRLTSFTLDGHKMLQAPYGTGIHLIRKGHIEHVYTRSASYVPGLDCTLVGSRSGTNAVAVWMILMSYGSEGGRAFCRDLVRRAEHLSAGLDELGISHYRHPGMNVVAMHADEVPNELEARWTLVPDSHGEAPCWRKVVVMPHVEVEVIDRFLDDLGSARARVSSNKRSIR